MPRWHSTTLYMCTVGRQQRSRTADQRKKAILQLKRPLVFVTAELYLSQHLLVPEIHTASQGQKRPGIQLAQ